MNESELTILLTGFEPFGKHDFNPSAEIAQRLEGEVIRRHRIASAVLPVTVRGSVSALGPALAEHRPTLVLALGLAAGRHGLSIERVGINILDFSIPDNSGAMMADQPIVEDGPAAYFATIPYMKIAAAWRECGIPGYVSDSAGAFICNEVLYMLLHGAGPHGYRAGFVHLPYASQQVAAHQLREPSMDLDTMGRGIRIALEACLHADTEVAHPPLHGRSQ